MGLRAQQQKQKHEAVGLIHTASNTVAGLVVSELANSRTSDVTIASAANSALTNVTSGTGADPAPVHPNDVASTAIKSAPHFFYLS